MQATLAGNSAVLVSCVNGKLLELLGETTFGRTYGGGWNLFVKGFNAHVDGRQRWAVGYDSSFFGSVGNDARRKEEAGGNTRLETFAYLKHEESLT